MPVERNEHVLIIKLGALGDVVQALSPIAAIRNHHSNAHITLLTTTPYQTLIKASGFVDDVWLDKRPKWTQPGNWLSLRRQLKQGDFSRVYDLQTSDRSSSYYRLFWPGPFPEWSGIARGCSHPHKNPKRDHMHTITRQAEQLSMAGIPEVPMADLRWIDSDIKKFNLPQSFALLVPGGAAHRPEKRWSVLHYRELAGELAGKGLTPVFLGAADENALISQITLGQKGWVNLAGKTSLLDIGALARQARVAIGNDTGPMHLISAVGCRSVVLYSQASDPALCAQKGADVEIIRVEQLASLSVERVVQVAWR